MLPPQKYTVEEVMREFAQEADSKGELDRTGFYLCFQRLQTDVELSSDDYLKRREVLRQLFEVFDTNGNGKVTYLCSLFVCYAFVHLAFL